jgi:galactokinase
MTSTVPLGGGLSSSAALEVATATLLEAVSGERLAPIEKALLCQAAEHKFAGVPCGIMDQFTSVLAQADHLLLLDCQSQATELVPLTDPGVSVLIINTNVRHELATGQYAIRRSQCEQAARALKVPSLREATAESLGEIKGKVDQTIFHRAKHVVSEIERTLCAAQAIRESSWSTVGQLMYASHFSLSIDYEVSCAELDAVVDIAQDIGPKGGVIGCRMTGGGFGGCAVGAVQTDAVAEISQRISDEYKKRTGIEPSMFVSRPAGGAVVIRP